MGDVLEGQTALIVVPTNSAGNALRVRLSNAFGREPVLIGAARVAHSGDDATALATFLYSMA